MEALQLSLWGEPHDESFSDVLGCLQRGGFVVASNARAARALRQSYSESQRAAGKLAWQTPPIHDWNGWLSILWRQYLLETPDAPLLLSPLQERQVWKAIMNVETGNLDALARLASDAWQLLSDFDVHRERRYSWSERGTADNEDFRRWAAEFERLCRKEKWMSGSDLPALLTQTVQQAAHNLPKEILLAGYDRMTPAQQRLLKAVETLGCAVRSRDLPGAGNAPELVIAVDQRDEITTCAWWVRAVLKRDSDARIAVIAQDIESVRGEIDRVFREILMPESVGIEDQQPMPYEFSLGRPLASVPVVRAALLLLRWLSEPLEYAAISWLILSGFLTDGESGAEMAALDSEIRRYGNLAPVVSLEAVANYPASAQPPPVRKLLASLRSLQRGAEPEIAASRRKSFSVWLGFAERILKQAHWPGGRTLESLEFQALARWDRLLVDLGALGFDGRQVKYSEFVTAVEQNANDVIFSPQSLDAPVQIMGPFESSGQQFDALWFLGGDERHWPPTAQPHPLLPLSLQRRTAMPQADGNAEWQLLSAVTKRIAASASECVFSYAERDEAGDLRVSSLFSDIPFASAAPLPSRQMRSRLAVLDELPHRAATVVIDDSLPIAWPTELSAGGSDILKRQSACAFQAFATRRLGGEEPRSAERGLTPIDRGHILHQVLELLWSNTNDVEIRLQTRDDLRNARASGRINGILDRHIEQVFNQHRSSQRQSVWMRTYLQVEKKRLKLLLSQWLDHEAAREPFLVAEQEKKLTTAVDGLKLNLRVDRIDEVQGGRLILDYKTGSVTTAMWSGERPDEPQLLLYALLGGIDDLCGVLFAQIRTGEIGFAGHAVHATESVTRHPKLAQKLSKPALNHGILKEWSEALHRLAGEFLRGEAAVAPRSYPETCKYCPFPSLCRIAETPIALLSDEEESSTEAEAAKAESADE